jgi:putative alpha-1,2-mannosidase
MWTANTPVAMAGHTVISAFKKRTIFSGWDVFRSQMPLQTIINPSLVNDLVNSMVTLADQKQKNYLERWELLNAYSGCMLGNPMTSVMADAYAKGHPQLRCEQGLRIIGWARLKNLATASGYAPGGIGIAQTWNTLITNGAWRKWLPG